MSNKKNKTYTAEFKASAVKLANESDVPVTETAKNLGINPNTLHTWIHKFSQPTEAKEKVVRTETHLYDELKQLKQEVARLRLERDFLKKAASYFAKEHP